MLGCRAGQGCLIFGLVLMHRICRWRTRRQSRHSVPVRKRCWMTPTALFICGVRSRIPVFRRTVAALLRIAQPSIPVACARAISAAHRASHLRYSAVAMVFQTSYSNALATLRVSLRSVKAIGLNEGLLRTKALAQDKARELQKSAGHAGVTACRQHECRRSQTARHRQARAITRLFSWLCTGKPCLACGDTITRFESSAFAP
jgi:hypothetical protein